MFDNKESFRNIRLVAPDDSDYIAFLRRMADKRPPKLGESQRSAGEVLGGLVEQCVRHWLSKIVDLKPDRILCWEQRLHNGRYGTMYREIDAIWQIDSESLCLYEFKLTHVDNMRSGVGIRQLNASADTLFIDSSWSYVLKRLVYIDIGRVEVLDNLPVVSANDEFAEIGVIWVSPDDVNAAALEIGVELPVDWTEPESREGSVEDPAAREWRQYLAEDKPSTGTTGVEAGDTGEIAPDSAIALALKRALRE